MTSLELNRSPWIAGLAIFAVLFGTLTIVSGGSTLLNSEAQRLAGNYVGFVLWFNFLAGVAYVVAGLGLWRLQRWSIWLSLAIAGATLLVFALFGLYILSGGSYEVRTVAAMSLRSTVWLTIAAVASKNLSPILEI